MKYAAAKFRKRHEIERLLRIHKEPRYLKQKQLMTSTAWKNYFYGKQETNDLVNEINRMEGIIGDMVRPVRDDYLDQLKARQKDSRKICLPQTNRHHRECKIVATHK